MRSPAGAGGERTIDTATPGLELEAEAATGSPGVLSHLQLVELARTLAAEHRSASANQPGRPLLHRVRQSARILSRAYHDVAGAAGRREPLTAAAEWFLDNFHIVEEQLDDIRKHLPRGYYAQLPKLASGAFAGFPRVYALASALIAHADGALDEHALRECLREYQTITPLSSGELWAVPIMLRVGLVENLERLVAPLEGRRKARADADGWADQILKAAANRPGDVTVLLGELAQRRGQLTGPHLVRLYQRLRGRGHGMAPVLEWLTRRVEAVAGCEIDDFIRMETHVQAADQVSISNTVTSFRLLDRIAWDQFFDETSVVEQALRADAAYGASDFRTRDACRHAVERIARRSRVSETEVAAVAVRLARAAAETNAGGGQGSRLPASASTTSRTAPSASETVPYYLIDDGTFDLERVLKYPPTARERLVRLAHRYPTLFYLGGIGSITALLVWAVVAYAVVNGGGWGLLALTFLVALVPASDLAVAAVNGFFTHWLPPRVLARQDFRGGIPADCRTLVAIPALLTSPGGIDELIERLEIHYLANPDPNLHFALLTDFTDAPNASEPEDEALVHQAVQGILELNARYEGGTACAKFFHFHRKRLWNESQQCWMGWERKRGKLMELNRLLRGDHNTTFTVTIGEREALRDVRYVLSLDSDTRLPPGAARRMVETLAHPLNVAVVDARLRRVVRGYGVLQPRVSITLTSAARSLFTRIFSGNAGVDPYTTAVSDVYQDLFGEGVFCGKGLYEIDVFEAVLAGRVAENTLLSHDLFEGSFARCGLATDVEVFDDYPLRYNSFAARLHRWIRGDWQLLRWLMPWVREPGAGGEMGAARIVANPLSALSRWRMLDNVRRSLSAPAVVVFLAAGWLVLPGAPGVWTLAALGVITIPILAQLAAVGLVDIRTVAWESYLRGLLADLWINLEQVGLSLCLLPHQAILSVDAACRTLWRMFVSRRYLLEWQASADAERRLGADVGGFFRRMWPAVALAVLLAAAIGVIRPEALFVAAPFLLLWAGSPWIAYRVSVPLAERGSCGVDGSQLSGADREMLRHVARRTWRFFQEVVTERDHWLPPDNYQADRADPVAHRTSPTNIGLLLLGTLTARDFGYVGLVELVDRLERTLLKMAEMERHRGHFYNWYDTERLAAITPFYVSTVDSGNLAGHLLAVKQGCCELRYAPVFGDQTLAGLRDTLGTLGAEVPVSGSWLRRECEAVGQALRTPLASALHWPAQVAGIAAAVEALARAADSTPAPTDAAGVEVTAWCALLRQQVDELQRDIDTLLPWSRLLLIQPVPFSDGRPLTGDLTGRRYAFRDLVSLPGGAGSDLAALSGLMLGALAEVGRLRSSLDDPALAEGVRAGARSWLDALTIALEACLAGGNSLLHRADTLADLCFRLFEEMDFTFLYDGGRDLFAVGFDVVDARLDQYYYDLLASECRLASFIAIAKGDVPQKHWFHMGRALTAERGERALISWGGTMFEYLMPQLVMRACAGTLLADTLPAVVRLQQQFAKRERVPWGISESGFGARDLQLNYQYRTFGVPALGLKPDLFEDLVVAPYATLLALPIAPRAAAQNLAALARAGLSCPYGFYEAIDYTPSRLPPGGEGLVVRELMAHHQGMALVSLGNTLLERRMPDRFHADPLVKAVELLLEERVPRAVATAHPETQNVALARRAVREVPPDAVRHYTSAQTSTPRVQLLSNRRYGVMLTAAGGGYSTWDGLSVTRWREDSTRDHWGQFLYVRDTHSGQLWSIAHQPTCPAGGEYDVYFTEDKAEFRRKVDGIIGRVEVAVSAEDNAEVRRVTLTNTTDAARELEVISYAEVVLAPLAADRAHAAFSNLFVETEYVAERNALLATRRPRSAQQARVWGVHVLAHEGLPEEIWSETSYETDRARFLGRGRTPANPASLAVGGKASRSVGPVLDPIFSLRQKVLVGPRQTVQLVFTTGAAGTRDEALQLAERYQDLRMAARTFELAWMHTQIELLHLNVSPDQASVCQRLASRLLYADAFVRAPEEVLARETQGQSGLWAYGISGDLPIVLAQVSAADHLSLVRELLLTHSYLRHRGLQFDLVILNEHPPSYIQSFEQAIQEAIQNAGAAVDQPGGVFLRRAELIADAGRNLLQSVARAVFSGMHGSLTDQLDWRPEPKEDPVRHLPSRSPLPPEPVSGTQPELSFFNGLGGFGAEGKEYTIVLGRDEWTPAPWINVLANEQFGCLAGEAGLGYTWSGNSRENRLTPWSNDPVSDPPGEALYLRNESTGRFWSVTPLPCRNNNPYVIHHGSGYTRYEHQSHGVEQELLVFVPAEDPVKIFRLRLRNRTDRVQELTATFYAEWVLGVAREETQAHVSTWLDPETGALLARNSYNTEFGTRIAFADVDRATRTWTSDRAEFLGRNGSTARPRAMAMQALAGASGASLDPCAAIRVGITLQPGEQTEVVFTLGQGADVEEARSVLVRYRDQARVEAELRAVRERWESVLTAVQVRTPDPAFDLLLNRWLQYQVLACRVWGRSAFYQSGGAFGFRDQLQDVMALVAGGSEAGARTARQQILLHAAHQFPEGDVQHWWHPPGGKGTRTHFSDDLLWLPFVTAHYVRATGDIAILDEPVAFVQGRPVAEGEHEYYDLPTVSQETAPLYEHCLRAIRRGSTSGAHGLPLMGTGDWNDGMNLVGAEGRGESVWVAWFLIAVLHEFAPLCERRGAAAEAAELRAAAEGYRLAAETAGWDGDWYRRAYFDDGTPLGSRGNEECQIDAIAQSWAVISGAGDRERGRRAMDAVEERLVRERDGLILLFTPPFDHGALDPGYIKGYVPGVRENGGQYTHAALWTVLATALLGRGDRAHELFALLNPIHHAETPEQREHYRVEPYVVAADVYGAPPHTGRGGWTWYTGSASWMYRVGLEALLGFQLQGDAFTVAPCIPKGWPGFELTYTRDATRYRVVVLNPHGVERGVRSVTLDGQPCPGRKVMLVDDAHEHEVIVVMG